MKRTLAALLIGATLLTGHSSAQTIKAAEKIQKSEIITMSTTDMVVGKITKIKEKKDHFIFKIKIGDHKKSLKVFKDELENEFKEGQTLLVLISKNDEIINIRPIHFIDDEFRNNFIDMRDVVDYETTETGLMIYLKDGSGYYFER